MGRVGRNGNSFSHAVLSRRFELLVIVHFPFNWFFWPLDSIYITISNLCGDKEAVNTGPVL